MQGHHGLLLVGILDVYDAYSRINNVVAALLSVRLLEELVQGVCAECVMPCGSSLELADPDKCIHRRAVELDLCMHTV